MNISLHKRFRERLRLKLMGSPAFLRLLLCYQGKSERLVRPDTIICLEGFPRSANSFTVNLLRLAIMRTNPALFAAMSDTFLAHHTHSIGNVRLAVDEGVETWILIRHPLSAISSMVVRRSRRKEASIDQNIYYGLSKYTRFYGYVRSRSSRLNLVKFETVTQRPEEFLRKVEKGVTPEILNLEGLNLEDLAEDARRAVTTWSDYRGRDDTTTTALPDDRREERKREIRARIENHYGSHLSRAQEIFESLTGGS